MLKTKTRLKQLMRKLRGHEAAYEAVNAEVDRLKEQLKS